MQACLLARACKLLEFDFPGLEEKLGGAFDLGAEAGITLEGEKSCIVDAITQAYVAHGCPMPTLPDAPPLPNFDDCLQELQNTKAKLTQPFAFLGNLVQVELDANMKPIKIILP